jgi:predicted transcriptional regulator
MKIRAIIDRSLLKSYQIPKEWSQKFEDPAKFYKKLNIYQNIRVMDNNALSFVVSEKGGILFLGKDDNIDYSQCLIDNHPSFIDWCKGLFDYYWKQAKSLKPFIKKMLNPTSM